VFRFAARAWGAGLRLLMPLSAVDLADFPVPQTCHHGCGGQYVKRRQVVASRALGAVGRNTTRAGPGNRAKSPAGSGSGLAS
jgi:hypothetical protein